MTCSTSSSSSRLIAALAVVLATASIGGCAGARRVADGAGAPSIERGRGSYRIALFPTENMSTSPVPVRGMDAQIARAVAAAGLEVVTGDLVERFLERHRIRYTGGIDAPTAVAAHDELGVDGVLLTSVQLYDAETVPRLALTMRAVTASQQTEIVWMGGTARTGNDAPGLLALGVIGRYPELEQRELSRLGASLARSMARGETAAEPCPGDRRFRPRIAFRSPRFDAARPYSVAVLPFVNESPRRRAGDIVALEFTRQLAAVPGLHVVEPGVVRDRLIRNRVVMEGGVSVDSARLVLEALHADLVVAGYVREFGDGDAAVDFTVLALEREHGTIVWESTSHSTGKDRVWFFGAGAISTSSGLACRMAREVVTAFVGDARR